MNRLYRHVLHVAMILVAITATNNRFAHGQSEVTVGEHPVVSVSIASLDGLLMDVNHITTIAGMPQAGAMLNIYVGAYSQGIDRSKPIGIAVRMVNGAPAPLMFLAIDDVKAMLKRMEPSIGPSDELEDGTMVIQVGQNLAYIRSQEGWAFMAYDRDALVQLPEDPTVLLQGMNLDFDIGIRANVQAIPAPLRLGLIGQMRRAFEETMKKLQERAEGDVPGAASNEVLIKQLETLVRDSEFFTLGISVDSEQSQVAIDVISTAVEGSELANIYNDRKAKKTEFAGFIRPGATFYAHGASGIGAEEQELSLSSIDNSIAQVKAVLAQQTQIDQQVLDKVDEYLPRVKEWLEATVKLGVADGGAVLLTDENKPQFLMGLKVADARKLEQLIKDILSEFENNPSAPSFKFDDGMVEGLTLHNGTLTLPNDPRLQSALGETLPLLIAVGDEHVYIGAGQGCDALLRQTIKASKSYTNDKELPLAQVTVSLLPALEYAYWINENSVVDLLLKTLRSNSESDKVRFMQVLEPNGQHVRFSVDDGVLQVLGTGAQAGQQQPEF